MEIIDFHTHCFPDFLAEKAINALKKNPNRAKSRGYHKAYYDGTIKGLSDSMDKAGITKSVIQTIATTPDQTENILKWALQIKNDRFEPFISIHQDYLNYMELLKKAKDNNIKGIKVHPHYQDFLIDDEKLYPLYEAFCKYRFIILFHSGNDSGFPGQDNASPLRVKKVIQKFPEMRMVLAHCGAYQNWDEVYDLLAGEDVYFENSFVLKEAGEEVFLKILNKHSEDKILFGTDSPWADQKEGVDLLEQVNISDEVKKKIFYKNYYKLLGE